jgi:hypothetical protein
MGVKTLDGSMDGFNGAGSRVVGSGLSNGGFNERAQQMDSKDGFNREFHELQWGRVQATSGFSSNPATSTGFNIR